MLNQEVKEIRPEGISDSSDHESEDDDFLEE